VTLAHRSALPFIIGVSGKRDLGGRDEAVLAALRAMFDRLDARSPNTDKILLSGFAEGTDLLAVQAALGRDGWRVVATLPLSATLFREDFVGGAAIHCDKLKDFERLLADERVIHRPLAPLRERPAGRPFNEEALRRASRGSSNDQPSNAERTAHYEQLGLFLARYCGLLVIVMDQSERPDRLGGTARVLRQRLEGQPDAEAAAIIARSDELTEATPLDNPSPGPVWLIDLGRPDPAAANAQIVRLPGLEPAEQGEDVLKQSLAGIDWIESLNLRSSGLHQAEWEEIERRAGKSDAGAGARLRLCRFAAAAIQRGKMTRLRQSVLLLAGLFLIAIASYEIFVELKSYRWSRWMSWTYLGTVLVAVAAYMVAARQRWQTIAEEYRAFSEALRVQLAWWDAGLFGPRDRVDELHLRGLHSSHATLRTAVGQAITAALLTGKAPTPERGGIDKWLDEQSGFFARRAEGRRGSVRLTETMSWFLFIASLGAATCLALMQTPLIAIFALFYGGGWTTIVPLVLVAMSLYGLIHMSGCFVHEEGPARRRRVMWAAWASAAFAGVLLALALCALAGLLPAPEEQRAEGDFVKDLAIDLVAIAVILPAAISGTIRFIAEKLSWVTELHAYEESRDRFARGRAALAATASDARKREIIKVLRTEALRENEAWLRAHRERPLEPVVGG